MTAIYKDIHTIDRLWGHWRGGLDQVGSIPFSVWRSWPVLDSSLQQGGEQCTQGSYRGSGGEMKHPTLLSWMAKPGIFAVGPSDLCYGALCVCYTHRVAGYFPAWGARDHHYHSQDVTIAAAWREREFASLAERLRHPQEHRKEVSLTANGSIVRPYSSGAALLCIRTSVYLRKDFPWCFARADHKDRIVITAIKLYLYKSFHCRFTYPVPNFPLLL